MQTCRYTLCFSEWEECSNKERDEEELDRRGRDKIAMNIKKAFYNVAFYYLLIIAIHLFKQIDNFSKDKDGGRLN